ncbi:PH domain-containing protein [Planococcus sp. APC 3906]|nr:PH domain-containing protein [Planococcus sp. APC 3906]MDN3451027.1 PH domain-containing protein [Planococcus sp. APC 3906]
MVKVNLMPNESIILKSKNVMHGGLMANYTDELILTNQNIIHVKKGVFGNTKNVKKYPLNQIKIFNGKSQAILGKQRNGSPQLEIYFLNGHEFFGFQSLIKKEVVQWINAISKLVTGHESTTVPSGFALLGTEYFSETIKGTVDIFKDTFGIQSKKIDNSVSSEMVSKKCISCSAPLTGKKLQIMHCKYCDTDQVL